MFLYPFRPPNFVSYIIYYTRLHIFTILLIKYLILYYYIGENYNFKRRVYMNNCYECGEKLILKIDNEGIKYNTVRIARHLDIQYLIQL